MPCAVWGIFCYAQNSLKEQHAKWNLKGTFSVIAGGWLS
jgi:hypothetical protein